MQVGGLDERLQPRRDVRRRGGIGGLRHSQRRTELNPADADARGAKTTERERGSSNSTAK